MALDLDILDFEIADRRLQPRVPIHQPLVLVDQALAVELDEHLGDGAGQPLVHGEALARPVGAGAQPAQLLDDGAAGFGLPFPDFGQEFLAAQPDAAHLPLGQLALDDQLGGDAGMVGARLPEHILAAHALEAGQDILQRVVEGVADMQPPGDIGRRDHDAEGLGIGPAAGPERAGRPATGRRCALPRPWE